MGVGNVTGDHLSLLQHARQTQNLFYKSFLLFFLSCMVQENSPAAIFGSPPFLTPIHKIFREGHVLLSCREAQVVPQSRTNLDLEAGG